jgi:fucose 4-O-acetylase-like acetyltransferase
MENQEYLADDCKKDKELFNSYVRALILPIIFLIFIVVVFYVAQEERKEIH